MINPINLNQVNSKYHKKQISDTIVQNQPSNQLELSDYKSAQAIFARNNITFRNLSQPIEVTDRYNKPIPGKDHLDLPNIHVYEYPDTNLQVFMNIDDNIDYPQIITILENNNYEKYDFIINKLCQFILKESLPNLITNNFIISMDSIDEVSLSNVKNFNNIITNKNFEETNLNIAKEILKNNIANDKYKNEIIRALYDVQDLKTKEEIFQEIDDVNITDICSYYDKYLKNSSMQIFLTLPKEYFINNQDKIFQTLNSDLNCKFLDNRLALNSTPVFINNQDTKYVDTKNEYINMYFPLPSANAKDALLQNFVVQILNSHSKFTCELDNYSYPIELKNNCNLKFHNELLAVHTNEKPNTFDDKKFISSLKNICDEDLGNFLSNIKLQHKEYFKTIFTGDTLGLIKNFELMKYQSEIFNIYEQIDEITQDDIKNYIRKYLIEQKPVIGVNN